MLCSLTLSLGSPVYQVSCLALYTLPAGTCSRALAIVNSQMYMYNYSSSAKNLHEHVVCMRLKHNVHIHEHVVCMRLKHNVHIHVQYMCT